MDRNSNVPLESLLPSAGGSIYKMTILVAKRAMQLSDGEKPMVEKATDKVIETAMREISQGKIRITA